MEDSIANTSKISIWIKTLPQRIRIRGTRPTKRKPEEIMGNINWLDGSILEKITSKKIYTLLVDVRELLNHICISYNFYFPINELSKVSSCIWSSTCEPKNIWSRWLVVHKNIFVFDGIHNHEFPINVCNLCDKIKTFQHLFVIVLSLWIFSL